jgi:hypothetical protein
MELNDSPQQVPVVVLPDRQFTPQPKTSPVVLKQGTKHLAWITLTILAIWVSLFQPTRPLQLTHDEVSQRNALPAVTPAVSLEQALQLEEASDSFPTASHSAQRQEPRTGKPVSSPKQTSEPRENRIKETSSTATTQQITDSAPALVPARGQQSSAPAPRRSERTTTSSANFSYTTAQTSQQEAAHMQLARLGIAPNHAALLDSVERGDMRTARLLLTAGVSPNVKNDQGWTPLMFAARGGQQDLARLLIAHGASVNAKNKRGGTALMLAALNNHVSMAETLLSKGAHINAKNSQGWTALTYASWKGYRQVVTALLNQGANTQVKDNQGWTPAQYASWRQEMRSKQKQLHEEIAEALGINLNDEPLAVVSHSDYSAISNLLGPRTEIY